MVKYTPQKNKFTVCHKIDLNQEYGNIDEYTDLSINFDQEDENLLKNQLSVTLISNYQEISGTVWNRVTLFNLQNTSGGKYQLMYSNDMVLGQKMNLGKAFGLTKLKNPNVFSKESFFALAAHSLSMGTQKTIIMVVSTDG